MTDEEDREEAAILVKDTAKTAAQDVAKDRHRFERVVYTWLFVISIGLTVALGLFAVDISGRHRTQVQTNMRTACDLNVVIDYLRVFNTTTPKSLRAEKRTIDKSLTKPSQQQLRLVLDEIVTVELAQPSLADLHPFQLADVPGCPGPARR